MKVLGYILNDWQISGVLTAGDTVNSANGNNGQNANGEAYDLNYSYQSNGGAVNLTGSPDYDARIVYVGDPGSGCSSDQYRQFNVAAVTGSAIQQHRPRIRPQRPAKLQGSHDRHGAREEDPACRATRT